jgi:hypothetical protein
VARFLLFLNGRRTLVLGVAAIGAVLSAKGVTHPLGFHDGPG